MPIRARILPTNFTQQLNNIFAFLSRFQFFIDLLHVDAATYLNDNDYQTYTQHRAHDWMWQMHARKMIHVMLNTVAFVYRLIQDHYVSVVI